MNSYLVVREFEAGVSDCGQRVAVGAGLRSKQCPLGGVSVFLVFSKWMLPGDGNCRDMSSEVFNSSGCSSVSLIFYARVCLCFWRIPFSLGSGSGFCFWVSVFNDHGVRFFSSRM